MTTFKDGPAKGTTLMLKRAPVFLRVVEEGGKIDALDQLTDQPRPGEKLHAYKLTGRPAMCHVHMARGRGGFYPLAEYAICDPQPTDEEMRTVIIWRAWCESQPSAFPATQTHL